MFKSFKIRIPFLKINYAAVWSAINKERCFKHKTQLTFCNPLFNQIINNI